MGITATVTGADAFGTAHRHATQLAPRFGTGPAGRWDRTSTPPVAEVASTFGSRTAPGRASGAALSGLVDRACQHIATSLAVGMLHLALIKYILLTIGTG